MTIRHYCWELTLVAQLSVIGYPKLPEDYKLLKMKRCLFIAVKVQ
ncbi:22469_t:CDS:2, partial [Gigaspora rosea]